MYDLRSQVGLIAPSVNICSGPRFRRMVLLRGESHQELLGMADQVEEAASLLAHQGPSSSRSTAPAPASAASATTSGAASASGGRRAVRPGGPSRASCWRCAPWHRRRLPHPQPAVAA